MPKNYVSKGLMELFNAKTVYYMPYLSNHADVVFFHIIQRAWKLKLHNVKINHNMIVK